jgi:hypothetical protein
MTEPRRCAVRIRDLHSIDRVARFALVHDSPPVVRTVREGEFKVLLTSSNAGAVLVGEEGFNGQTPQYFTGCAADL